MASLWPLTVVLTGRWPSEATSVPPRETGGLGEKGGLAPSDLPPVPDIVTVAALLPLAAALAPKAAVASSLQGFWTHPLGTSFIGCSQR